MMAQNRVTLLLLSSAKKTENGYQHYSAVRTGRAFNLKADESHRLPRMPERD
jgi:hypothetical protein